MAQTYKITKPDNTTIVEVKTDGVVVEKYSFNNSKDIQLAINCLVIDGLQNSSGTLKIPFEQVEDNLGTSNASELMTKYAELGFFLSDGGEGGNNPNPIEPIEGTWEELNDLAQSNSLITGQAYILSDYQCQYIIDSSDSSDKEDVLEVIGQASGYAFFEVVDESIINSVGDTAFIESLPASYTGPLSVGDLITVNAYFSNRYIRFSPSVTTTGIKIKVLQQRYPSIPSNEIVLDSNGKPILQPGGVLNTDVHDGTPYGQLDINPEVPFERIFLTALNENLFSSNAESLTYVGDKLTYDFNDVNLLDGNGVPKPFFRKGFILSRTNLEGNISVNKDWRVQRYRRFSVPKADISKVLHRQGQNNVSTAIYRWGEFNFDAANDLTSDHYYFLKKPFELGQYIDFTKINENPFLSGGTNNNTNSGLLFPSGNDIKVDISIPLLEIQSFKDLFIIPIEKNSPIPLVENFIVNDLEDSIFEVNNNTNGASRKIDVIIDNKISESSCMSGVLIRSGLGDIKKLISLDLFEFYNDSLSGVDGLTFFAFGQLKNNGYIENLFVGSDRNSSTGLNTYAGIVITPDGELRNTMIGGKRPQSLRIESRTSHCLIRVEFSLNTVIKGLIYLTSIISTNGTNTINLGYEIDLNTYTGRVPNKTEPGYIYVFNLLPNNARLNNFNDKKNLVYKKIDSNENISLITEVIPT